MTLPIGIRRHCTRGRCVLAAGLLAGLLWAIYNRGDLRGFIVGLADEGAAVAVVLGRKLWKAR
jgi:hypothetical protein